MQVIGRFVGLDPDARELGPVDGLQKWVEVQGAEWKKALIPVWFLKTINFFMWLPVARNFAPWSLRAALADTISLERTYYPTSDADLDEAERASRRALELDPGLAEAHAALAFVLFMTGRLEEAETEFRTAISLDPQIADARYFFARMRFQQGRLEEAARLFGEAAELRKDHDSAFFAAQALEALGREEQAQEQYERALVAGEAHMDLNPDDARAATIRAVALYRVGREDEGLQWGHRAVEIDPQDAGVRYNVACLFAVAGQRERAIELTQTAVDAGFGNREWLERDPDLEGIRDDPRFQALLRRMDDGGAASGEEGGGAAGAASAEDIALPGEEP